ncbi:MAG: FAD-dependent oxidoreductase [Coriobacteriales bacterium]|jgi:2,4-dienoyl-CoA reductase-like NADH-dependent reductase (Old Yellow Enzyme family)/thioredoxin reductase
MSDKQNKYYPLLGSPIKLGNRTFKNRIFGAPMGVPDVAPDFTMTDDNIAFYDRRSSGGAASVCVSECVIDMETGLGHTNAINLSNRNILPSYTNCAKAIHKHDCMAAFELSHAGKFANARNQAEGAKERLRFGPSAEIATDGQQIHEMTEDMILAAIENYGKASAIAKEAGFDMAFIHGGHGWIIQQFMSPAMNRRTDKWGGSLENRMRFALAVIESVRKAVGRGFPIEFRMSGAEYMPGGYGIEEAVEMAKMIDDQGLVDLIHVSAGVHEYPDAFVITHPSMFLEHGSNVHLAAEIKKHVKTPVATVGGLNDPDQMEEILASGKADVIEVSRQLLVDPFFPQKALTGHKDDITKCCRCFTCFKGQLTTRVIQCALNPVAGKEIEHMHAFKPTTPKKVAVVGGGPAGMEAALTAKKRGHDVILLEKNSRLGGELLHEEFIPFKEDLFAYATQQAKRVVDAGIDVRLNTEVTPELLESLNVDVAILATGAKPVTPPIEGIKESPKVVGLEVLLEKEPKVGQKVVIIGGGLVGCETAIYLDGLGRDVTVVEMMGEFAADAPEMHHIAIDKEFRKDRVDLHLNTMAKKVTDEGLVCTDENGNEVVFPADTILLAAGFKSDDETTNALRYAAPWTMRVGDAVKARQVLQASAEGHYAALDI